MSSQGEIIITSETIVEDIGDVRMVANGTDVTTVEIVTETISVAVANEPPLKNDSGSSSSDDYFGADSLAPWIDASQRGLGIAVDLEMATRPAVEAGFTLARLCTNLGFQTASTVVDSMDTLITYSATTSLTEENTNSHYDSVDSNNNNNNTAKTIISGGLTGSQVAEGMQTVIKTTQYIVDSTIAATHTVTKHTLRASTELFLASGAKEGLIMRAIFGSELAGVLEQLHAVMGEVYDSFDTLNMVEIIQTMDLMRRIELLRRDQPYSHMRFVGEVHSLVDLSPYNDEPNIHELMTANTQELQRYFMFAAASYGVAWCKVIVLPIHTALTVLTDADTIVYFTGIDAADIIEQELFYFSNELMLGYYIAIDRSTKSIVVALKGTNNLKDVLMDLTCKAVPFDHINTAKDGSSNNSAGASNVRYVHKGFIDVAVKMGTLLKPKVLELLKSNPAFHDYRVVLTGHSLGAAVATVLAMLWNDEFNNNSNSNSNSCSISGGHEKAFGADSIPGGKRLVCFAFAPPGIISAQSEAEARIRLDETYSYITSVVLGNDLISRASLASLKNLCKKLLYLRDSSAFTYVDGVLHHKSKKNAISKVDVASAISNAFNSIFKLSASNAADSTNATAGNGDESNGETTVNASGTSASDDPATAIDIRKMSRILDHVESHTATEQELAIFAITLDVFKTIDTKDCGDDVLLFPAVTTMGRNSDVKNAEFSEHNTSQHPLCACKWIEPSKCLRDVLITTDCVATHMPRSWLPTFEALNASDAAVVPVSRENTLCYRLKRATD
jgi:hypothetical protein